MYIRTVKIDLENALLHVRRVKEGSPAAHPPTGNEPYCGSSVSRSYLGHKSIQHTVRYTELAPTRFKSLFRD
jgi:hypothetical protein